VRRFHARVEFRRDDPAAAWVLAGVVIGGRFWPARDGVEPIRGRLRATGLVGWADLPTPIVAPDEAGAAEVALEAARARWPRGPRGP
jgi:hypothetical protein